MPAFLEKLSQQIYADHGDRLGDLCIVLPNRRAALFIRKYLGQIIENTTFLPDFYSIEDFVTQSTGRPISDTVALHFALYDIHTTIEKDNVRTIDEFLPYSAWMLSDFNDVDMYLVDAGKLFTYLSDAKAISLWNLDGSSLTEMEQRYLTFFRSLGEYYRQLHATLDESKQSYQGMAFRMMAENIETACTTLQWDHVIFAGFNALTSSEEKIIGHLLNEGKAKIYWDADSYYLRNDAQEAGKFLRKHFNTLSKGSPSWEEDNFSKPKRINILGVPKDAGQVKYAGEIISQAVGRQESLDNTAVVLPDEALLIPLLNSIPDGAGRFNVTMGLPLNATPLFNLFDNILSMHQNADRYMEVKGGKERTYFTRDLIRLFNHPWLQMLEDVDDGSPNIPALLRSGNRLFARASELKDIIGDAGRRAQIKELLFPAIVQPDHILDSFNGLLKILRAAFIEKRNEKEYDFSIELEYLFRFHTLVKRLQGLMSRYQTIQTVKTLHLIFRQLSAMQRIPFHGEPLQGLQVMGMLETRTLDFRKVVVLSMNEGILPSSKTVNSFIPHDIKKEFNLPTYKDNNAVFAYHFYRLIQRAEEVYLVYNTEAGMLGGDEKSRFITQLIHEAGKYNPEIKINEDLLSLPPLAEQRDTTISIEKDETVMQLLSAEAKKGLHPTSLSRYINCPLQFYLSRLIKIEEVEEPEETIDNRILGIVIHESLKNLLGPYLDKPLSSDDLRTAKNELEAEVKKQFILAVSGADLDTGKNHLILNVAISMLKQFINKEMQWLQDGETLQLKLLENRFSGHLNVEASKEIQQVKLTGTIDRTDKKGDSVRILDYKTGFVSSRQLNPGSWDKLFSDPEFDKSFQLMMYSWLYHKNNKAEQMLTAGVFSLRAPGQGPVELKPPEKKELNGDTLDEFEQHLVDLLKEIFDEHVPFTQTEDEKRCSYCTFREICNRHTTNTNY